MIVLDLDDDKVYTKTLQKGIAKSNDKKTNSFVFVLKNKVLGENNNNFSVRVFVFRELTNSFERSKYQVHCTY